MNVQIQHVIVHTPEQTREIIEQAWEIASEHQSDYGEWAEVFRAACQLLGQRWTFAMQPQAPDLQTAALLNGLRTK